MSFEQSVLNTIRVAECGEVEAGCYLSNWGDAQFCNPCKLKGQCRDIEQKIKSICYVVEYEKYPLVKVLKVTKDSIELVKGGLNYREALQLISSFEPHNIYLSLDYCAEKVLSDNHLYIHGEYGVQYNKFRREMGQQVSYALFIQQFILSKEGD